MLHCVSNYPCSDSSLNLNNITTLKNTFKLPIGFSDHSDNKLAAITAMGLGCRVIERHITLNKGMKGLIIWHQIILNNLKNTLSR